MSIRRLSLTAVILVALTGCSTASPAASGAPQVSAIVSASATPGTAPSGTAGPPASTAAQPVAGGGATDFCSAYAEWKTAVQADTPQLAGAGFRAAATDLRTYAPAEIKVAAGLYADVMDEVGQAMIAGAANPETLGAGQSAERRQAIADSITWITKNCHF